MSATYNQVNLLTGNKAAVAAVLRSALAGTVRIAWFGDSQETSPGGEGREYVPYLNYAFWEHFGNTPETPFVGPGFFGATNPPAEWCVAGATNNTGATRLAASYIPPGVSPVTVTSTDYGIVQMLQFDAYAVVASDVRYGSYFAPGASVEYDLFAATNAASGELKRRITAQTTGKPAFSGGTEISAFTNLAMGLANADLAIIKETITCATSGSYPYLQVVLKGQTANAVDVVGGRFRSTTNAAGVVVSDFSAGGYTSASLLASHANAGLILAALELDMAVIQYGANDATTYTAAQFKTNLSALITQLRVWMGATLPIVIMADVARTGLTGGQQAEFDQYPGVAAEIAETDPLCLAINLRLATENIGLKASTETLAGLTDRGVWAVDTVYALNDYVRGDGTPDDGYYRCVAAHTATAGREPGSLAASTYDSVAYWVPIRRHLKDGVHYTPMGARRIANIAVSLLCQTMGDSTDVMQAAQLTVAGDLTAQVDQLAGEVTVLAQSVTGTAITAAELSEYTQDEFKTALETNNFTQALSANLQRLGAARQWMRGPQLADGSFDFYAGDDVTMSWVVTWNGTVDSAMFRLALEEDYESGQPGILQKTCQTSLDGDELTLTVTLTAAETAALPSAAIVRAANSLRAQVVVTGGTVTQTVVDVLGVCRKRVEPAT